MASSSLMRCACYRLSPTLRHFAPPVHNYASQAHSTGLYGPQGRGVVCALGLANQIPIRLHTFGKALACSGAVVLCSPLVRSYLINYARPLIYSTVMPHMNVVAIREAVRLLDAGAADAAASRVHALASFLSQRLATFLGPETSPLSLPTTLSVIPPPILLGAGTGAAASVAAAAVVSPLSTTTMPMLTTSPILPILTAAPKPLARYLQQHGFLVRAITYPTVPRGSERVRICLHANNTEDELAGLAERLRLWVAGDAKLATRTEAKL